MSESENKTATEMIFGQENQSGQDAQSGQQPQVSQPNDTATKTEVVETPKPKTRAFVRTDVKPYIEKKIILPSLFPVDEYDPFQFRFKIKLSGDAMERREQYLSLAAAEQTIKQSEQALDEVCDLLYDLPQGFGDLKQLGLNPGESFKSYVNSTTDATQKAVLMTIVEGANSAYWNAVAPREFRG